LNPKTERKFLFYYLGSPFGKQLIQHYDNGTAQPNLSASSVARYDIPLAPLPKQRAIVGRIEQLFSELDNGVANLKAARAKLDLYRQAVLNKAFEGELTREWREQQTDLPSAEQLLAQIQAERQRHYEQQLAEWKSAVKNREEAQ
jgi:type I restriction enzyme S subunit